VKQPDFTIITPSFKQLDYLGCCIASVADQEGVTVEHIVQDAGSPGIEEFAEKTAERLLGKYGGERVASLDAFELLHLRTPHGYSLRMFKEKDSGMYDAVNKGLKKGTGKICAYLNCDEQYLPGTLRLLENIFQSQMQTEVVFGGVVIVDSDGKLIARRDACHLSYPHVMTCHLPNFTAAMFFRRKLLEKDKAWFDVAYRDLADAVWVLARLQEGTQIDRVSSMTTAFTDTGANMNLSPNAQKEARELRESAPKPMLIMKPWWALLHRLRKLIEGAYWPTPTEYAMYLRSDPAKREGFYAPRANPLWWDRLHVKR
jgi:glycosyltransferase involved in cell wall biosynthesis